MKAQTFKGLVLSIVMIGAASASAADSSFTENAKEAIERATNQRLDQKTVQSLAEQIEVGEAYLACPQQIADNGTKYIFLACANANVSVGLRAGVGANGLACYDWRGGAVFLIGAGYAGLTFTGVGVSAGIGLLTASLPESSTLEGTYVCGGVSGAMGSVGAKGFLCGDNEVGMAKKLGFLGYQFGWEGEAGGMILQVVKF